MVRDKAVLAGVSSVAIIIVILLASSSLLQAGQTSSTQTSQVTTPPSTSSVASSSLAASSASSSSSLSTAQTTTSTASFQQPSSSTSTLTSSVSCAPGTSGPITTAFSTPDESGYTNFVPMFMSYPRMNVSFAELSTGTGEFTETYTTTTASVPGAQQFTESYSATAFGGVGYKIVVSYDESNTLTTDTAWVLKNGTVAVFDYLGRNITGGEAVSLFQGLMYPFTFQTDYDLLVPPLTASSLVHGTSLGTQPIGDTSASVTRYSASAFPLHAQICSTSLDLTAYALSTASVLGESSPLIVALHIAGNATYEGQTNQIISLSLNLTSVQSAPS